MYDGIMMADPPGLLSTYQPSAITPENRDYHCTENADANAYGSNSSHTAH